MAMNICTCNNCGNILQDFNPQSNAVNYSDDLPINSLVKIYEDYGNMESGFWGCPTCNTDSYLVDDLNINSLNEESKKIASIYGIN